MHKNKDVDDMQKAIILTPDDTVEAVDYEGYTTIHNAVDGIYQTCGGTEWENFNLTIFCNEEFLIRDDEQFDKLNAVASAIYGGEIRGNAVVLIDVETSDGIDSRGFEYAENENCECSRFIKYAEAFIEYNKENLNELHQLMDGRENKSEPQGTVISVDDLSDLFRN